MKDPMEVLRQKEDDLERVRQEVDALRIVARLLGEEPYSTGIEDLRKVVEMP